MGPNTANVSCHWCKFMHLFISPTQWKAFSPSPNETRGIKCNDKCPLRLLDPRFTLRCLSNGRKCGKQESHANFFPDEFKVTMLLLLLFCWLCCWQDAFCENKYRTQTTVQIQSCTFTGTQQTDKKQDPVKTFQVEHQLSFRVTRLQAEKVNKRKRKRKKKKRNGQQFACILCSRLSSKEFKLSLFPFVQLKSEEILLYRICLRRQASINHGFLLFLFCCLFCKLFLALHFKNLVNRYLL